MIERLHGRLVPVLAALLLAAGCAAESRAPSSAHADPGGSARSSPSSSPSGKAPVRLPRGTISLAFGGDVHFTGRTKKRLATGPGETALGPISAKLAAADFAMVNLESAVTTRGVKQAKKYHFRTPPEGLRALKDSGVDAVSMANNHAVDYGADGLADTLAATRRSPVAVLGIGADERAAYRPHIAGIRGVKLAVLAASQVPDLTNAQWRAGTGKPGIASAMDPQKLAAAVAAAKAHADVVVVYLHWGTEGQRCPGAEQRDLADQLARAGATAVVGTHAHILLGAGMLKDTYVSYGLGNFLWYGTSPYQDSDDSGAVTLTVAHGRVRSAVFTPALIDGRGVPVPQRGATKARINERSAALRSCSGLAAAPTGTG